MNERETPARKSVVIFGASGDLTRRKLVPALHSNYRKGRLDRVKQIVGFDHTEWTDKAFRPEMRSSVQEFSETFDAEVWQHFATLLGYQRGDLNAPRRSRAERRSGPRVDVARGCRQIQKEQLMMKLAVAMLDLPPRRTKARMRAPTPARARTR